ncbi:MAG: archaeosortase/exosortase family protein, partial [Bacteroidota bacterium]
MRFDFGHGLGGFNGLLVGRTRATATSFQQWQTLIGTLLLATVFYTFLPDYLPHHPTDILGVLLLPFVAQKGNTRKQWFYLSAALVFWLINREGLNTLYYASFICAALFWWEYLGFRFNYLPLFLLAVIAPITRQIFYTWSFPIRLEMSTLTAKSLTFIGLPTEVTGNVIYFNETAFSVDPACTGLKMLTVALVFAIFILAWYERQLQKRMNFISIVGFLLLTLVLAIFANF